MARSGLLMDLFLYFLGTEAIKSRWTETLLFRVMVSCGHWRKFKTNSRHVLIYGNCQRFSLSMLVVELVKLSPPKLNKWPDQCVAMLLSFQATIWLDFILIFPLRITMLRWTTQRRVEC